MALPSPSTVAAYTRENSIAHTLKMGFRIARDKVYFRPLARMEPQRGAQIFTKTCRGLGYDNVSVAERDGRYLVTNQVTNESFWFPRQPSVAQLGHVAEGYQQYLATKYEREGFVEVDAGDTVADVGAFVGAFARYAAQTAEDVLAIEPGPDNVDCLECNTAAYDAVSVEHCACSNESGEMKLNLSNDPTDHSLMDVDTQATGEQISVPVYQLDELLSSKGINHVDYLKADAEGLEPEVLEGVADTPISKLAIDCSAERNGEQTVEEVTDLLESRGYECRGDKRVFARQ